MNDPHRGFGLRRLLAWTAPVLLAALAALSVVGAFRGAERAWDLFHSVPLAVFWVVTAVALGVSAFALRPLRRPGPATMHLGFAAVLVGGLWGSPAGHRLAGRLTGDEKMYRGVLLLAQGESDDVVFPPEASGEEPRRGGRLPFHVRLNRFWVEHYPREGLEWRLFCAFYGEGPAPRETREVDAAVGRAASVPGTDIRLHVEQVAERPPQLGPPTLHVLSPKGNEHELPAVPGTELRLGAGGPTLRVVCVFERLRLSGEGEGLRAVEGESGEPSPAAELEVRLPDGRTVRHFALTPEVPVERDSWGDELTILFLPSRPRFHYRASHLWARVELWRGRRAGTRFLAVSVGDEFSEPATLEFLYEDQEQYAAAGSPVLVLATAPLQVKDQLADVSILRDGREAARQTVEYNEPLHYGGYHIYHAGEPADRWQYAVFTVRSDSGLYMAYAGFAMLVAGAAWTFWLAPAVRWKRGRR